MARLEPPPPTPPEQTPEPLFHANADAAEEAKRLRLELKERKRQIHKMHEVYGRLKEKFVAGGGSAAAFDAARDVDGLEYDVRFAESRRAAERKRAEQLALDLGKAQRELERARRAAGTALGEGHRANAGGGSNVVVHGRKQQTNSSVVEGRENEAPA